MSTEKEQTNDNGDALGKPPSSLPTASGVQVSDGGGEVGDNTQGGTAAAATEMMSEEATSSSQDKDRPLCSDSTRAEQLVEGASPSPLVGDAGSGSALVMDNSTGNSSTWPTAEPAVDRQSNSSNDDDDDDDDADDDQGPPPLVLERQPPTTAPKQFERCAPTRTVSSASSQDSLSASATPVVYRSVREIFGAGEAPASSPVIVPVAQLRKLATAGSLDSSHRGVSWRVLLGYVGPDRSRWESDLHRQRGLYWEMCRRIFANPPIDDGANLKQQPRRRQPSPSGKFGAMTDDSSRSSGSHHHGGEDHEDANGSSLTNRDTGAAAGTAAGTTSPSPSVPQAVRDAWKRSGRDAYVLESVCSGINALRLSELSNSGNSDRSSSTEEKELSLMCDNFVNTAALLDEIRKDVVRTCSDLSFYLDPALGLRRYAVLERILLISATLSNRAVRYVQGMNEIVAILYFVLTSWDEEEDEDDSVKEGNERRGDEKAVTSDALDGGSSSFSDVALGDGEDNKLDESAREEVTTDWADNAEPDAYWLFHALLSEMSDVFVPDMDTAETGIQGRIAAMQELLRRHDAETAEHLEGECCYDFPLYRGWPCLVSLTHIWFQRDRHRYWVLRGAMVDDASVPRVPLAGYCPPMGFHVRKHAQR
jgi:Rab-GTPase-TBC domain